MSVEDRIEVGTSISSNMFLNAEDEHFEVHISGAGKSIVCPTLFDMLGVGGGVGGCGGTLVIDGLKINV